MESIDVSIYFNVNSLSYGWCPFVTNINMGFSYSHGQLGTARIPGTRNSSDSHKCFLTSGAGDSILVEQLDRHFRA